MQIHHFKHYSWLAGTKMEKDLLLLLLLLLFIIIIIVTKTRNLQ